MSHALPAGPPPPARRQMLVGTTLAGVATLMLIGGMLAIWILERQRALDANQPWLPKGTVVPEVPSNVMLITVWGLCVFAQWAAWSARRADRAHTALALGITALMAIAVINAQAYVWSQTGLPIADSGYAAMFYAVTGTMVALVTIGLVFTGVTAFRSLGGRTTDVEIVNAHALNWYILAAAFTGVWLIVYVTK